MIIKNRVLRNVGIFALAILLFILGAFSTTFTNGVGVPWLKVLVGKLPKQLARDLNVDFSYPREIQSSLYAFETTQIFPYRGIFQTTLWNSGRILAVERNQGELYSWNPTQNTNSVIKIGNIFEGGIDDREGLLVMDVHWAFNKMFISIVIPNDIGSCESLAAYEFILSENSVSNGSKFFDSPCVEDRANSQMWAGRFTNSTSNLYMSVGEQRFDRSGFPKSGAAIKSEIANPQSVFGKVLKFSQNRKKYEIFSSGHRNAQGLHYSTISNQLFESEHGSLGGDEINVLRQGFDYGWPEVAYGRAYGWIFASGEPNPDKVTGDNFNSLLKEEYGFVRGTHSGFAKPLHSWIPSTAVGALKQVSSTSDLTEWRKSLLVATFADKGMHRIEMTNGRVVLDEYIDLGGRVRDFEITEKGEIFLAYDEGNLIYLKAKRLP